MDSILLNGRYTVEEAEQLLSELYNVKTNFHIAKIDTVNLAEEDIEHSERRIRELDAEIRRIKQTLRAGNYSHVAIHAKLSLEFCPDYHSVLQN